MSKKVPFVQWEAVMRTMIAYHKVMSRSLVHGAEGECEVVLPELPPEVMESAPKVVVQRVYVRRGGHRNTDEKKKYRHPLVGTLRGKIVPWVFGARDKIMEKYIGISVLKFRAHIETMFTAGMNWENHGYWHLDHVRLVSSFNHNDEAQVRECWHYTNFQPLWGRHNLKKGAKLNYGKEDTIRSHAEVAQEQP